MENESVNIIKQEPKGNVQLWFQFDDGEVLFAVGHEGDRIELTMMPDSTIEFKDGKGKSFKLLAKLANGKN